MYIGYLSLENWLTVVDKNLPVYACLVTEPGQQGQYSQRIDQLIVLVEQPEGELVHYCRLHVASLQYVGNSPYNNHNQNIGLAEQAWDIVQTWLKENGLVVRPGLVSFPKDLRLTDGWAHFLEFDLKEHAYRQTK
jgi:hypothetical protein